MSGVLPEEIWKGATGEGILMTRSVASRRGRADSRLKKKKDQLALAQYGNNLFCDRPDPCDPGGLGAEESGIERTGPTQCLLFAIQQGGRLAEVGRHYDSR